MCLELNFSWNPRKPHFVPFLELVRSWTCSSLSSLWVLFQLLSNSRSEQKRSNCLQRLRKLRHEVLPSEAELHFLPFCSLLPFPHCSWLPPLIPELPYNILGYKMLFITFFQQHNMNCTCHLKPCTLAFNSHSLFTRAPTALAFPCLLVLLLFYLLPVTQLLVIKYTQTLCAREPFSIANYLPTSFPVLYYLLLTIYLDF